MPCFILYHVYVYVSKQQLNCVFLRKECTLHFFHRREEERKEKSRHVRVAGYATVITVADILINS